jgi:hypothetical protein
MRLEKFERLIKKFTTFKTWENIEELWLNHIPAIDPIGSPPEISVVDFVNFRNVVNSIQWNESLEFTRVDIQGIRSMVLHEGIFWIHKALHVLGIAEKRALGRQVTWSLSDGYHAALFSAQAILNFWGIATPAVNQKTILIDVWTDPDPLTSKAKKRGETPIPIVQLAKLDEQIGHVHVWLLLQRLLRLNNISIWNQVTVDLLIDVKHSDFAAQRNAIHYTSRQWLYPDLFGPSAKDNFSFETNDLERCLTADNLQSELSLALGITLAKMAITMFRSVAEKSVQLQGELALLDKHLSSSQHPYMVST